MTDEFFWGTYPNETTRGRIQTETLLASGAKHNSNVVVVWTLGRQEPEVFFSGGVALVVFFDKMMDSVVDLTCHCEW